MRSHFCRLSALVVLTLLASSCARPEITEPDPLPTTPVTTSRMWTPAASALPRAISRAEDIPRPRVYAQQTVIPRVKKAPMVKLALRPTIAPPRDLRVMTFNLRVRTIFDGLNMWDRRRDLVVQRIRNADPDLLGTQEGLAVQEDFLRGEMPDYQFFGVGRGDGKREGEMCGVFFRASRFEMIEGGHFWLSLTPDRPGSRGWGAIFPRMVTWVKLRQRSDGQTICWFNTHFDAWNARARAESAKVMLARMEQIAGPLAMVITGDFNADPGSAPYRTLLHSPSGMSIDAPLVDTFRAANPSHVPSREGTMHNFSGRPDGQRIDWILATSPQFEVVTASIDRARGTVGYPSDHFPVTATLRLAPSAAPLARIE